MTHYPYYATIPLLTGASPGVSNDISVSAVDSNGQSDSDDVSVFGVSATVDSTGPSVSWATGGSNVSIDGADNFVVNFGGVVSDASGVASLAVTLGGTPIFNGTSFPSGQFIFPVTLRTGSNAIVATFTDKSPAANQTVVSFTVTLAHAGTDVTGPTIQPQQSTGNVTIAGQAGQSYLAQATVTDPSGVQSATINGTAVTVGVGGLISLPVTLVLGVNTITFAAVDNATAHNTSSKSVTVTLVATLGPALAITTPNSLIDQVQGQDGLVFPIVGSAVSATAGIASLTIAGAPTPIDPLGNFSSFVVLRTGQNTIQVTAVDTQTVPQQTTLTLVVTLIDGPDTPVDIELSQDQIRMGARIHERGLE